VIDSSTYLFLLHELGGRAIIAHIFAENRGSEASIDIGCTDLAHSSVEYKIVALWSKADGVLFANKNKREYIAILSDINTRGLSYDENTAFTFF
jgi:hypothetical protein